MNNQRPNPKSRYHSDAFGSLLRTGLSLRMPVERARATVNTAQVPEFGRYWTSDRQSLGKSCDTSAPPSNARFLATLGVQNRFDGFVHRPLARNPLAETELSRNQRYDVFRHPLEGGLETISLGCCATDQLEARCS